MLYWVFDHTLPNFCVFPFYMSEQNGTYSLSFFVERKESSAYVYLTNSKLCITVAKNVLL